MSTLSRFQKYVLPSIGALSGVAFVYYVYDAERIKNKIHQEPHAINKSSTTNYSPSVKWDWNWDKRDPKSLVKPNKSTDPEKQNKYNEKCEAAKSKVSRHLILIRHGQYNQKASTDQERTLTELGRRQAELTGKRLLELGLPYSLIVKSTMTRAQETSSLIEQFFPKVKVQNDSILVEGFPIQPDPPINSWRPSVSSFQEGPRIEAAFRKYFHRAPASQKEDSYTVLVCHGNVIRYFFCRAMQFPPEAWLRFSVKHGSITWFTINSEGAVSTKCLGDAGHLPPECLTTS